jgi:hypothetical protein
LRLLLDLADFVDLVDFAEEAVSDRGKGRAKGAPPAGAALDCLAARPGLAAPGLEPSLPIVLCVLWCVLCFTGWCCLALAAHPTVLLVLLACTCPFLVAHLFLFSLLFFVISARR